MVRGSAGSDTALADYRGGPIKIVVLNDQSGLYADIAGTASIWMARKAVEDFGAAAKGMKVDQSQHNYEFATHRCLPRY